MNSNNKTRILVENWGTVEGRDVKKYTIENGNNQEVDIITYGATLLSMRTPDKRGKIVDVICGFENIEGYVSKASLCFGSTIGRVANRIENAQFEIDDDTYKISKNEGDHSIHGGLKGWGKKLWESSIENDTVVMTLLSEDGDEGYPGAVIASASFKLTDDGQLIIKMEATTTKPTIVNMTNHSYFNLAGHGANSVELYKHLVTLNADRWLVTDEEQIPTGEIRKVENSDMDLRQQTMLGSVVNKIPGGGFDYNFCLPENVTLTKDTFVAKVVHPPSGRVLEVFSDQPGVQFYTSNKLPNVGEAGIEGKEGHYYFKHAAFCLETQNYPDAINHEKFPNSILRPQHTYTHNVTYKFGIVS